MDMPDDYRPPKISFRFPKRVSLAGHWFCTEDTRGRPFLLGVVLAPVAVDAWLCQMFHAVTGEPQYRQIINLAQAFTYRYFTSYRDLLEHLRRCAASAE
jgi:hypothetical protein